MRQRDEREWMVGIGHAKDDDVNKLKVHLDYSSSAQHCS